MPLLAIQINQILAVIDAGPFARDQIQIDEKSSSNPVLRFAAAPHKMTLAINGAGPYTLDISPGPNRLREQAQVSTWEHVLGRVDAWLRAMNRELAALDSVGVSSQPAPAWAITEMPEEYSELVRKIETLQERERRMRRMAGLLYEAGERLNRLVRDCFRALEYPAEQTSAGEAYDVDVSLPSGGLLIEVTGIEGPIDKVSKKISQAFSAVQSNARPADRVCIAVNAYRDRPLADRERLEVVTPDALALLIRLNAIVFTTTDLFKVWTLSLADKSRAQHAIERLQTADAGIVRLL